MSRFGKKPETKANAKDSNFLRIGDIQIPFDKEYDKAIDPEDAEALRDLAKSVSLNFYFSNYIKKHNPEIFKNDVLTVRNDDRIMLRFGAKEGTKDFVIGGAYVKTVDGQFIEIGNMTLTKKSSEADPTLKDTFRSAEMYLTFKVYLPKEVNSYNIENGEKLIIYFKALPHDPKFVVGHVSARLK